MLDDIEKDVAEGIAPFGEASEETSMVVSGPRSLNDESKALIEQIIAETDEQKVRDLTHLFNANQNKKTMARVNKLSDLLDTITDQALERFTARPDEISNKELFDGLKTVQDLIERGQKQVAGAGETPLIQINQQNNEVNVGGSASNLNRDSRERVKSAVLSLLDSITNKQNISANTDDIVTVEPEEGAEDTVGE
jgi:prophage DNA circulation protein